MTYKRMRCVGAWLLAIVSLGSCGRSLIEDPSFDLWCGQALCQPWESTGVVQRVPTWHVQDFGVELADGAALSQLSTQAPAACIHFEVIADVTASADVRLELDFNDDGSKEFDQVIPESHWSKLSFNASAPKWYRGLRFTLRKAGRGRAVLAQISATDDGCQSELPDTGRANGVQCNEASQCAGAVCDAHNDGVFLHAPWLRCGECASDEACAEGMRCGTRRNANGLYAACVPLAQALGAVCDDDAQCESGHCTQALAQGHASCGECASDADCAPGRVCGVSVSELGPARACRAPAERALGALCVEDAECISAVCVANACSACRSDAQCPDGESCRLDPPELSPGTKLVAATLCGAAHPEGAPCNRAEDCASGSCQLPPPSCYACDGEPCDGGDSLACALPRQLPGTCR